MSVGAFETTGTSGFQVTGTLRPGFDQGHLDAAYVNAVAEVCPFGLEDVPGLRLYLDPDDFRDAWVSSERLSIRVGADTLICAEPPDELGEHS